MLICIRCHVLLTLQEPSGYHCRNCSAAFRRNHFGFYQLMLETSEIESTTEEYAEHQRHCGNAVFETFLRDLVTGKDIKTVLDVGCGIGETAAALGRCGLEAYGADLPALSPFWAREQRDPQRFFAATATRLPFADNSFDLVYSFGVIEHIGTILGHCTLAPDYQRQRQEYANEIMRVTKPGGLILIACPNKAFPVDVQHGPGDMAGKAGWIRSFIFEKTGMNLHKTWGKYHLLSYSEVERLFCGNGRRCQFTSLPLRNYFHFGRFQKGFLKPFAGVAQFWVNNIPGVARRSFLNPYLMAEIRKQSRSCSE